MKIEAGKLYRTRNGEKAFVSAVGLQCPFVKAADPYPVSGFIETRSGLKTWTLEGRVCTLAEDHWDLVAEWEDRPEFRPFEGVDEFTPHLNRWIISKERPAVLYRPFYVENKGVRIHFSNGDPSTLLSWNLLFEKYMFLGGDCCGVRNT